MRGLTQAVLAPACVLVHVPPSSHTPLSRWPRHVPHRRGPLPPRRGHCPGRHLARRGGAGGASACPPRAPAAGVLARPLRGAGSLCSRAQGHRLTGQGRQCGFHPAAVRRPGSPSPPRRIPRGRGGGRRGGGGTGGRSAAPRRVQRPASRCVCAMHAFERPGHSCTRTHTHTPLSPMRRRGEGKRPRQRRALGRCQERHRGAASSLRGVDREPRHPRCRRPAAAAHPWPVPAARARRLPHDRASPVLRRAAGRHVASKVGRSPSSLRPSVRLIPTPLPLFHAASVRACGRRWTASCSGWTAATASGTRPPCWPTTGTASSTGRSLWAR